tara:strand:+ start:2705 stop:3274 length:570 start_codon:yes stop_codon:yes gene_type:complete
MAKIEDTQKVEKNENKAKQPPAAPASQIPETVAVEVKQANEAKDPLAKLSKDDADSVRLIDSLLNEYASTIKKTSHLGDSARSGYGKLHGAYRTLMSLRGEAHKEAARVFMRAFKQHGKGSLDYDMRCRHIELLPADQRGVFASYLDLLSRFEKSSDKGAFRNNNNIDRLLGRILDPELAASINSVFPG